tara:strand:+ start:309 stop:500 length:192 start_codon:yes stop_codon:yes gene_type:complete
MKKSKEPSLGDFLTDVEDLLKDWNKIQEGNITEEDMEKIDNNNNKFNKKYKDFLPEDDLDSEK